MPRYGVPFFSVLSTIIVYFARIIWIFLLILLAHGWSITRVALPDRKILFGILGSLLVVFIILFFWQEFGVSQATLTSAYAVSLSSLLVCTRWTLSLCYHCHRPLL